MVSNLPVQTAMALCFRAMVDTDAEVLAVSKGFDLALSLAKHEPGFMAEMAPLMSRPHPMDSQAAWAFKTFVESAICPAVSNG